MKDSIFQFLSPILIGMGATLTFDLWGLFLKHAFNITPSNFCAVGRWILSMPEGIFRHSNIGSVPQKRAECSVGWIGHYMIGVIFAIMFAALVGTDWLYHPTLVPAIVFGVVSVLAPFFLLQPALGLGIAASRTPDPMQARFRSLVNHVVFGFGLYLFGEFTKWLLLTL